MKFTIDSSADYYRELLCAFGSVENALERKLVNFYFKGTDKYEFDLADAWFASQPKTTETVATALEQTCGIKVQFETYGVDIKLVSMQIVNQELYDATVGEIMNALENAESVSEESSSEERSNEKSSSEESSNEECSSDERSEEESSSEERISEESSNEERSEEEWGSEEDDKSESTVNCDTPVLNTENMLLRSGVRASYGKDFTAYDRRQWEQAYKRHKELREEELQQANKQASPDDNSNARSNCVIC